MKSNGLLKRRLVCLLIPAYLLNLSFVSAQSSSQSLFPEYYATQSIPPDSQPTFDITKRRRVNNCDQDWMREIEAQDVCRLPHHSTSGLAFKKIAALCQADASGWDLNPWGNRHDNSLPSSSHFLFLYAAFYDRSYVIQQYLTSPETCYVNDPILISYIAWADAGEYADIAQQWSPQDRDETLTTTASGGKWQAAMDYFMGKDSTNDGVKYTIALALNNEKKIHHPNWILPEAVVDVWCGTHPQKLCRERTNPFDPTGPKVTAYAISWTSRGTFWNTYNILLCPRFFYEKDSIWGILSDIQDGRSDKDNASIYKRAWGHTYYHELMHLDPVIAGKELFDPVYGGCDVARLAHQAGCSGNVTLPGWDYSRGRVNSMANPDNWAFFAGAAYFQNILKMDAPATVPDCDVSAPFDPPTNFDVEGILEPDDEMDASLMSATVPPDPRPDQTPAPDGPTPVMPIDPNHPPPGLATPYLGASAYFASRISSMSISSTATPGQSSACQANQIGGSCIGGSYPTLAPYSGIQPPICNKVDDPGNNLVRVNSDKAKQAATDYCTSLASNKIILSAGSSSPAPAMIPGAAEKNGHLALTVQFDVSGCPADKSASTVDFTKMSPDECQQNFFLSISEECAQDPSWPSYVPNFTIEGGVYLNDCGLFGMLGEP